MNPLYHPRYGPYLCYWYDFVSDSAGMVGDAAIILLILSWGVGTEYRYYFLMVSGSALSLFVWLNHRKRYYGYLPFHLEELGKKDGKVAWWHKGSV